MKMRATAIGLLFLVACHSSTHEEPAFSADAGANDAGAVQADAAPAAPFACDPLVGFPTSLPDLLAAGKDSNGVIYAVGGGFIDSRIFASAPPTNKLLEEWGSSGGFTGSMTQGTINYVWDTGDPRNASSTIKTIMLQMMQDTPSSPGTPTIMAISASFVKSFDGTLPADAEKLTLVPVSSLASLSVVGLPLGIAYVADATDGTVLLVASEPSPSTMLRVFYGHSNAMRERPVLERTGTFSDASWTVRFTVDDAMYVAEYTTLPAAVEAQGVVGGGPGPVTLTFPGGTSTLTVRTPTPKTLPGYAFTCLP